MKPRHFILFLFVAGCLALRAAMTTNIPQQRPIPFNGTPSDDTGIRLTCIDDGKGYIGRLRLLGGVPTLVWSLATDPFTTNLPVIVDINGNQIADLSGKHLIAR